MKSIFNDENQSILKDKSNKGANLVLPNRKLDRSCKSLNSKLSLVKIKGNTIISVFLWGGDTIY